MFKNPFLIALVFLLIATTSGLMAVEQDNFNPVVNQEKTITAEVTNGTLGNGIATIEGTTILVCNTEPQNITGTSLTIDNTEFMTANDHGAMNEFTGNEFSTNEILGESSGVEYMTVFKDGQNTNAQDFVVSLDAGYTSQKKQVDMVTGTNIVDSSADFASIDGKMVMITDQKDAQIYSKTLVATDSNYNKMFTWNINSADTSQSMNLMDAEHFTGITDGNETQVIDMANELFGENQMMNTDHNSMGSYIVMKKTAEQHYKMDPTINPSNTIDASGMTSNLVVANS